MVDGEVEAFCQRVRPRLVGALALYCGDVAVAEELAQEALARAWLNWRRVRRYQSPDGWVHHVAFNLARSHLRRRRLERLHSGQPATPPPAVPDRDWAVDVRRAIRRLPVRQRQALVLRYYADLSVDDTAAAMSCSAGTVKLRP